MLIQIQNKPHEQVYNTDTGTHSGRGWGGGGPGESGAGGIDLFTFFSPPLEPKISSMNPRSCLSSSQSTNKEIGIQNMLRYLEMLQFN